MTLKYLNRSIKDTSPMKEIGTRHKSASTLGDKHNNLLLLIKSTSPPSK